MNGKKISKILDFKKKKAARESGRGKTADGNTSQSSDDTGKDAKVDEVKPENDEVDFIVQDLKKNGTSEAKAEEIWTMSVWKSHQDASFYNGRSRNRYDVVFLITVFRCSLLKPKQRIEKMHWRSAGTGSSVSP